MPEQNLHLHYGNNLVSFNIKNMCPKWFYLNDDFNQNYQQYYLDCMNQEGGPTGALNDVFPNVFPYSHINKIIGEGVAAERLPDGNWVGSLSNISPTSGYWLYSNFDCIIQDASGDPTYEWDCWMFQWEGESISEDLTYTLHKDSNLLSFPKSASWYDSNNNTYNNCTPIRDAIPANYWGIINGIVAEGLASTWVSDIMDYLGSLTHLCGGEAYWVTTTLGEGEFINDFKWGLTPPTGLNSCYCLCYDDGLYYETGGMYTTWWLNSPYPCNSDQECFTQCTNLCHTVPFNPSENTFWMPQYSICSDGGPDSGLAGVVSFGIDQNGNGRCYGPLYNNECDSEHYGIISLNPDTPEECCDLYMNTIYYNNDPSFNGYIFDAVPCGSSPALPDYHTSYECYFAEYQQTSAQGGVPPTMGLRKKGMPQPKNWDKGIKITRSDRDKGEG